MSAPLLSTTAEPMNIATQPLAALAAVAAAPVSEQKIPGPVALTRQVAMSSPPLSEMEQFTSGERYAYQLKMCLQILKTRFSVKLQYILSKFGADEQNFEAIFQEFYGHETQYVQDVMIPLFGDWFQSNEQRRSYPVEQDRLFKMWSTSEDFLKLCQAYIFMLKDCHNVFAPGAPFLHFVEEAMNRFLHTTHGWGKNNNNNGFGGSGSGFGYGNRKGTRTQNQYNENKAMSYQNESNPFNNNKRSFQPASDLLQIPNQAVWNQGGFKKQKNGQYYQEPVWQSGWDPRYQQH